MQRRFHNLLVRLLPLTAGGKHAAAIVRNGKIYFLATCHPGQHAETRVLKRYLQDRWQSDSRCSL